MDVNLLKPTQAQLSALAVAFRRGHALAEGNRTGGALRRMVERMAAAGLFERKPPFRLTMTGLQVLHAAWTARCAKRGCDAYRQDLEAVTHRLREHMAAAEAREMAAPMTGSKTPGQLAYEADVARHPTYDGRTLRRRWDQISDADRQEWERRATPPSHAQGAQP